MRKVAWLYRDWACARPSIGCDEFARRTAVLPWPVRRRGTYDGWWSHYYALAIALPWTRCRVCGAEDYDKQRKASDQ